MRRRVKDTSSLLAEVYYFLSHGKRVFLLSETKTIEEDCVLIKEARNSFHFPQTSFTNSFPNTVWFIVSV